MAHPTATPHPPPRVAGFYHMVPPGPFASFTYARPIVLHSRKGIRFKTYERSPQIYTERLR
jgi:hypothetical protein